MKDLIMSNTPIPLSRPAAEQALGLAYSRVTGRADKWFFLDGTIDRALRADSCLVEPADGDLVLVCGGATAATSFILAVLTSADAARSTVTLPGGAALCTDNGKLRVDAEGIALAASQEVSLQAPKVGLTAVCGEMSFTHLQTSAQEVNARFGKVTSLALSVQSTVGRLIQRAQDCFRSVENLDETRAGRVRIQVKDRFHLTSRHASVIAEGQVKIDGEKIDLG
jgi:hypothetical protein